MKKNKILLSIALCLVAFASMFTMFIPTTKVSAYDSMNGIHQRPNIPINIITFTDGTYYDTCVCPTAYIMPTAWANDVDSVILNSYDTLNDNSSANVTISYVYSALTNTTDLGGTNDQGTQLHVVGKNVNNTINSANLAFLAQDFIYRTSVNNTDWNVFKIRSNISFEYTVLGKYITPLGDVQTLSFFADVPANRLVNLTTNLNSNIVGNFEYVYFEYLNIYFEKTSTSYVSNFTADIFCSANSLYGDNENLGEGFVDELVNYNPPSTPEQPPVTVNLFESIASSIDSLLSIEILPDISFYDLLIVCVCIPLLVAILKAWLGG